MATFQPTPTYYRVTWNLTSPKDYTGTGTTAGGISPYTSNQYHTMVALTSYNATPTMNTGDTLSCNGYIIGPFDSGDNVAAIVDRLTLNEKRISDIAQAVREVVKLADPIGDVIREFTLPNGLNVQQVRVPMGVVAMIYVLGVTNLR